MKPAILAVSAAALLLACAGCDQPAQESQVGPVDEVHTLPARVASPSPSPIPNDRCVPLSPAMIQEIVSQKKPGKHMEPLGGVAVQSEKHPGYYILAVNYRYSEDPRLGHFVGAWASTSVTPGAPIYSMPGSSAELWTEWPGAGTSPMKALIGRDEAEFVAVRCVTF